MTLHIAKHHCIANGLWYVIRKLAGQSVEAELEWREGFKEKQDLVWVIKNNKKCKKTL